MKTTRLSIVTVCFFVALNTQAATHYVDAASPSPTAPYTSWATAATNIQNAVDASVNGEMVMVTNGHYLLTSEIVVNKDITIQSVSGPEVTIVDGQGIVRCFNLGNFICVVSGLTITNGNTTGQGGGIYCLNPTPVVSKCIIIGNAAYAGGGMFGGTANDCMISFNIARYGGGKAAGYVNKCTIRGNSAISEGGGLFGYDISANNCVIINNSAEGTGGGIMYGAANNCTIIGNGSNVGGGVAWVTANNCIVWYNHATFYSNIELDMTSPVTHTCSPDLTHGTDGNITNAPLFVDQTNGNHRLLAGSPCINAGDDTFAANGADLDGYPRFIDGTVDMGAYEYGFQGCFITNFVVTNSLAILEWTAFPMWESEVRWTGDLIDGFQSLAAGIDYPLNSYTDTVGSAESSGFYEVEVRMK